MEKGNEINDVNLHSIRFAKLTSYYATTKKNYKHLLQVKNSMKEMDVKRMHQLDTFRNLCKNQENIILDLHGYKEKNELLRKENSALVKLNHTLKLKIIEVEKNKVQSLQEQIVINKKKLEEHDRQTEIRVRQLEQQLQAVQAANDARTSDLQNNIINLARKFEDKLKKASDTEYQLKSQIDMQNKHLSLTVAVYQKKLCESEQKVVSLEKERVLYGNSKGGFVTAQKLLITHQATHSGSSDLRTEAQVQNYISKQCEKNINTVVIAGNTRFKPFTVRMRQNASILSHGSENRPSNRNASHKKCPFGPCHSQTRPFDLDRVSKHVISNSANDNNRNMDVNAANNDKTVTQHIPSTKRTRLYNHNR